MSREEVVIWLLRRSYSLFEKPISGEESLAIARQALLDLAKETGEPIQRYACTLVALLLCGDKAFTIHIGDGLIGVVEAGTPRVLSAPDNGKFANETVFVTSGQALERIRIDTHEISSLANTFVLMTDGVQSSLYDRNKGQMSLVAEQMASWPDSAPELEVETAPKKTIVRHFRSRTLDDCSIAIVRRSHPMLKCACPQMCLVGSDSRSWRYDTFSIEVCTLRMCQYFEGDAG